jgi:hypothetical protein
MSFHSIRTRNAGWAFAIVVALCACGDGGGGAECLALPCAMPMALIVTITAQGGGPVTDASIAVTGAITTGGPCQAGSSATTCDVPGYPGRYAITVSAPGYQSAGRTVNVTGEAPKACGCSTTDTQQLAMVLTPAS